MSLTAQFNFHIGGKLMYLVVTVRELLLPVYDSFCIL